MSETPAEATATEAADTDQTTEKVKPTETVEFWKAKAREQEKRAKDNADAAARLKEFEDRDKTEAEKVAERATAAESRAAELEARALRLEVAFEKGLTQAQAKRLVGSTREELEADADEVLRDFPVKPTAPVGDIGQGARTPAPVLTDGSPRSLIAAGIAASDAARK